MSEFREYDSYEVSLKNITNDKFGANLQGSSSDRITGNVYWINLVEINL